MFIIFKAKLIIFVRNRVQRGAPINKKETPSEPLDFLGPPLGVPDTKTNGRNSVVKIRLKKIKKIKNHFLFESERLTVSIKRDGLLSGIWTLAHTCTHELHCKTYSWAVRMLFWEHSPLEIVQMWPRRIVNYDACVQNFQRKEFLLFFLIPFRFPFLEETPVNLTLNIVRNGSS